LLPSPSKHGGAQALIGNRWFTPVPLSHLSSPHRGFAVAAHAEKGSRATEGLLAEAKSSNSSAIEFRDSSWVDEAVFTVLRRHKVVNVSLSSRAMPMCLKITADFAYVRFHGLEAGAAHNYSDRELKPWAKFLRRFCDFVRPQPEVAANLAQCELPAPVLYQSERNRSSLIGG
jgi:hypothetical protein